MHHTVVVIGQAKEVSVVINFKVAFLPLWRGWTRKETSNKQGAAFLNAKLTFSQERSFIFSTNLLQNPCDGAY